MKYVKSLILLGCTVQGLFAPGFVPPPGHVQRRSYRLENFFKNETSRLMLSLDSTLKQGLQIQVQFFDKNGKQIADSISSFSAPGSIQIPQEATQCTLSTVVRHLPAKGSKIEETVSRVFFNKGKMINLNFNNPSYMLSTANGVYSATPVKAPVNQVIQEPTLTTPAQIIRNLENELLNKISYLAAPNKSCELLDRRPMRIPRPGTPEYAQYQQEELKDEAYFQKSHISTLEKIISYVETEIEIRPNCG